MAEMSVRLYSYVGSLVFGLLALVFPVITFSGIIKEFGLEKLGMFDALSTFGLGLLFAGFVLIGLTAFKVSNGGSSKLAILGGLLVLAIYGINNGQISSIKTEFPSFNPKAGFGHTSTLISAVLGIVSGFLPGPAAE